MSSEVVMGVTWYSMLKGLRWQSTLGSVSLSHHQFTVRADIGVLRDKPPHEGKNSGWIQWYEESFMSNVWHLALIMYMDRHTLGLQNRNLSLKIYIMNMVGYKLMQKYVLLSLFHDFTKRIILWHWVLKRSEETLWLYSQYMLLQCWSCVSNTLVFNTQPRITNR